MRIKTITAKKWDKLSAVSMKNIKYEQAKDFRLTRLKNIISKPKKEESK